MPQGLTTPNWYNDDTYIKDKVAECNVIKFENKAGWTADEVRAAIAKAYDAEVYSPDLGYSNFVDSGNAENCSPNPLFNVMEYLTAKANQLNDMNDGAGYEGNNAWTAESVLKYFNDHHITAWDHFTTAGQFEDINPSNSFDLSDFFAKKAEQCNSMEFDGKSDWDAQAVKDYFQTHGINAVEVAVNADDPNVVSVPPLEQVTVPAGQTPWQEAQIQYNDIVIPAGQTDTIGTTGNDNFIVTVAGSQNASTLLPDSTIDGNGGIDKVTVNMTGNFRGFNDDAGLTNIETVDLVNGGKSSRTFNAKGTDGIGTWNLDESKGAIKLADLPGAEDITVNISGLQGGASSAINFAKGVTDGAEDSLTIGLENVAVLSNGRLADKAGRIATDSGIENVSLDVAGNNFVDLSGVPSNSLTQPLTINGSGDLTATGVNFGVIEATEASGDLDLNLGQTNFQSANLGSGDDVLTVNNIEETSSIDGGKGDDQIVLNNISGGFNPEMADIETMTVNGVGSARNTFVIGGENISGLETLEVNGVKLNQTVRMGDYEAGDLNLNTSNISGTVELADVDAVNMTVEGRYNGNLILEDTESLVMNVGGTTEDGDRFTGSIQAANLEELTINATRNDLNAASSKTVLLDDPSNRATISDAKTSNLGNVAQLTVTGNGWVDLSNAQIGNNVADLTVDASALNAQFNATFSTNVADAELSVSGSNLQSNGILINTNGYSTIEINGSITNDTINLKGNYDQNQTITGNLDRFDTVRVIGSGWTTEAMSQLAKDLGITASQVVSVSTSGPSGTGPSYTLNPGISAGDAETAPANATVTAAPNPSTPGVYNLSGLDFDGGKGTTIVPLTPDNPVKEVMLGGGDKAIVEAENQSGSLKITTTSNGDQTVFVQQGAKTTGQPMDGPDALDLTVNGAGVTTVTASIPGSNSAAAKTSGDWAVETLNIDVANADGTALLSGASQTINSGGIDYGQATTASFTSVTDIVLEGEGNVVTYVGFGKGGQDITVNASNLAGGIDMQKGGITASNIDFTGSAAADNISMTPWGNTERIDLGAGSDYIQINLNQISGIKDGPQPIPTGTKFAKVTVEMGSNGNAGDGESDTIFFNNAVGTGIGGDRYPHASQSNVLLSVEDFETGSDHVTWSNAGHTVTVSAFNAATLLASFGITKAGNTAITADDVTLVNKASDAATEASIFVVEGNSYVLVNNSYATDTNWSLANGGSTLIQLVGVDDVTSMATIQGS